MLENLDLSLKVKKPEYRRRITDLRNELRSLQLLVREAGLSVVVLFEGWNAAGKGDSIGHLVYPLDPRGFKVYTTRGPNEEEQFRPFLWRFWTRLPGRGDFAFFDRSWYRRLLEDRVDGLVGKREAELSAVEIREFERQLSEDGVLLIKFWLHITEKEQRRRIKSMAADRYERWRAARDGRRSGKSYKKYTRAAEQMFESTSTANAPWTLVEATDPYFRRIKVFETTLAALNQNLALSKGPNPKLARGAQLQITKSRPAPLQLQVERSSINPETRSRALRIEPKGRATVLDQVDLTRRLARADYEKKLDRLQTRLRELGLECYRRRLPVVILYEGWDAAGKGGNIKRLTQELDPRGYEVIPIAAPDAMEKARHYLWRFWRRLPKAGHIGIFDRSWYGRVLVERVEGFCSEAEWRRAYQEINTFEKQLTEFGSLLFKFWLHLSPEEQLRRFEEREKTPHKQYKITPEDWRNRLKWNDYKRAVAEMIERTSTTFAPWTIVEAEDKLWARIKTLSTVVGRMEERLEA